jgi:small subunit ribosomal protein S5
MNNHRRQSYHQPETKEFEEKVVQVNRVSKKTKGGNKIGFSVLVVVGDKKGSVGVGLGKGPDVLSSIKKASRRAKKRLIHVPLRGSTIPFAIENKLGAATVLMKPAPEGTGVIAGGAVRAVVEAAGIRNIVSKIMGTRNQASNVYATFDALSKIRQLSKAKGIKLGPKPASTLQGQSPQTPSKPPSPPVNSTKPFSHK